MKKFIFIILFFLITPLAFGQGCDSNTQILLHFDGTDAGTTFTDENCDGSGAHVPTAVGSAQLDTAEKKFGTASALFQGTDDYITIPDSGDFDFYTTASEDWSIDFFIKFNTHSGADYILMQLVDNNNYWYISHTDPDGWRYRLRDTGGSIVISAARSGEIADSDWHHMAFIRISGDYGFYKDGTQTAHISDTDTLASLAAAVRIGDDNGFGEDFDGWMDEFRIQNSNYFGAAPNSTPDDTITVPTVAYSVASGRRRQSVIIISKHFIKRKVSGYDIQTHNYIHKDVNVCDYILCQS
jgi:hypothetical protein